VHCPQKIAKVISRESLTENCEKAKCCGYEIVLFTDSVVGMPILEQFG
jgi:hypothetical protein